MMILEHLKEMFFFRPLDRKVTESTTRMPTPRKKLTCGTIYVHVVCHLWY